MKPHGVSLGWTNGDSMRLRLACAPRRVRIACQGYIEGYFGEAVLLLVLQVWTLLYGPLLDQTQTIIDVIGSRT
jgi:hypothetical protein